jgi:uncharacterized Zn-binding protein involved in type VI secretion
MTLKAWALLGDTGSHSGLHIGTITGSATKTYCEDKLVARVGDAYTCPTHGAQTIVGPGSTNYEIEDQPLARTGDTTSCGAIITGSAVKTFDT